ALAVNLPLGSLGGIATSGSLNVDADAGIEFTFGLALGTNTPVTLAPDVQGTPRNGQLSGDATFTVKVGSNAPVTLTVTADPNNQSLGDLVDDINTALRDANLQTLKGDGTPADAPVVAAVNSNTVTFSLVNSSAGLTLLAPLVAPGGSEANSAVTELGIPGDGRLGGDSHFQIALDNNAPVDVTVSDTSGNESM